MTALTVVLALALHPPLAQASQVIPQVRVTYYPVTGYMANGDWTYVGAAACPRAYLGHWVHLLAPDLWDFCADTGAPDYFETGTFRLDVYAPYRPAWLTQDYYDLEVF